MESCADWCLMLAGLTLDQLELHDIGLPPGACASGIKQLVLTNPRWDDLRLAMSADFSPDLKASSSYSLLRLVICVFVIGHGLSNA